MPRTKLRLYNHTKWSTRNLRTFLIRGMKAKGVDDRIIEIRYGRTNAIHGWAVLGGRHIQLNLPGPSIVRAGGRINMLQFAQVFEHEIDHTLGLEHKDMVDWWTLAPTWHKGLTIAWTDIQTPETPQERQARRGAAAAEREAHARKMLKKAETRLKRAKTIRAKWAKKVRYYDRKKT